MAAEFASCGAKGEFLVGDMHNALLSRESRFVGAQLPPSFSPLLLPSLAPSGEARSRAKLNRVFETHGEDLLRVLRGYLKRVCGMSHAQAAQTASELFGEWWEEIMRTCDRFDPSREPLPWIARAGYFLVLRKRVELLRRASHELPARADEFGEGNETVRVAVSADIVPRAERERELRDALQEWLEALAPSDRRVLRLHVELGGCGDALARALNVSRPAARQQLCRARKRLQRIRESSEAEPLRERAPKRAARACRGRRTTREASPRSRERTARSSVATFAPARL